MIPGLYHVTAQYDQFRRIGELTATGDQKIVCLFKELAFHQQGEDIFPGIFIQPRNICFFQIPLKFLFHVMDHIVLQHSWHEFRFISFIHRVRIHKHRKKRTVFPINGIEIFFSRKVSERILDPVRRIAHTLPQIASRPHKLFKLVGKRGITPSISVF